jgi:hypothetical protein
LGSESKKYEIGKKSGKFERDKRCVEVFLFVGKGERDHWEDLGADRIIVIKPIFKK